MSHLVESWEQNPWSRVSFGTEFVLDPTGTYLLTSGPHKHLATKPGMLSELFEKSLQDAFGRLARIRAHEKGSEEEQAAIAEVVQEVRQELVEQRPCLFDADASTDCTFKMLWQGEVARFEKKLSGIFAYPDPTIRREIAAAIGRYATRNVEDFGEGDKVEYLCAKLSSLLDDPESEVQKAAAIAVFQCMNRDLPPRENDTAALVAAARELVSSAVN